MGKDEAVATQNAETHIEYINKPVFSEQEVYSMLSQGNLKEKFAEIKKAKKGFSLTFQNLEMEEGEETDYLFVGLDSYEKDGKKVPTVKLLDENGKGFFSASSILVSELTRLAIPSSVTLTYEGEQKGSNYTYKKYQVYVNTL